MSNADKSASGPVALGMGLPWHRLSPGDRFTTLRRTITETDLVNFISVTGMLEAIFIDAHFEDGAISGRPVPGALTCALIEGMQFQTLIQRTGLALLEMNIVAHLPVRVGDTIHGEIEITDVRPTSKGDRGIVTSRVEVMNQQAAKVMTYVVKRLVSGSSPAG